MNDWDSRVISELICAFNQKDSLPQNFPVILIFRLIYRFPKAKQRNIKNILSISSSCILINRSNVPENQLHPVPAQWTKCIHEWLQAIIIRPGNIWSVTGLYNRSNTGLHCHGEKVAFVAR